MRCGIACLAQEGTAATLTTAITDVKKTSLQLARKLWRTRAAPCKSCDTRVLQPGAACRRQGFPPVMNDRIASTGNVGQWLGMTFIEANGAQGSIKYYDSTGTQKTVDLSGVQYVMYYHEALSVISNFEVARIVDSERFAGSLAQVGDEYRL